MKKLFWNGSKLMGGDMVLCTQLLYFSSIFYETCITFREMIYLIFIFRWGWILLTIWLWTCWICFCLGTWCILTLIGRRWCSWCRGWWRWCWFFWYWFYWIPRFLTGNSSIDRSYNDIIFFFKLTIDWTLS